ncbi:MAG: hypothetical protein HY403_07680 [Elusimicrobia bacterium]|nr:hypothetical protein [Elusimicrobiota bacterium]
MKAKAGLSVLLSVVLATASAAQTAVAGGRLAYRGGASAVQVKTAPPSLAPAPSFSPLASPNLAAFGLTPAPVLAAPAVVAPLASVAPDSPEPTRPLDEPERTRAVDERFAELKAAFDEKKVEDISSAEGAARSPRSTLAAAESDGEPSAAAEPPAPAKPPRAGGLLGFSKPLVFFLVALIIAEIGIEAQTAVIPPLIAKVFGDVSIASQVGMAASLAEFAGAVVAPIASKRLGLKKAYLWSTGLRIATGGLVAGLLAANWLGIGGLVALLAFESLLLGVSYITEKSIPAVIVDQDQAKLERFKAARQIGVETVATLVPIATGALVASFGFVPALIAFPAAMAVSMTLVAVTLRLPDKLSSIKDADLPGPKAGSLREFFKSFGQGASEIARKPVLLLSLLAYSFVDAPTSLIYWLLAPAFALHLAGPGAELAATAYSGMITGLYSLGAIIGSLLVMRQQRRYDRERQAGVLSEAKHAEAMRRSMLAWTATTALGLGLFLVLAVPFAGWGTLTLPALAFLAFGAPQIAAKLKLESYFQSHAPKGAIDDATAVLEGASSIVIALSLWIFGQLLLGANVVSAFWLAAAAAPYAAILLALCWALARATR